MASTPELHHDPRTADAGYVWWEITDRTNTFPEGDLRAVWAESSCRMKYLLHGDGQFELFDSNWGEPTNDEVWAVAQFLNEIYPNREWK